MALKEGISGMKGMTSRHSIEGMVPATATRDRLNHRLANVSGSVLAEELGVSRTLISNIRQAQQRYVDLDLAKKVRDYARTYVEPATEVDEYLASEEAADYIDACRRPIRYRAVPS